VEKAKYLEERARNTGFFTIVQNDREIENEFRITTTLLSY